MKNGLSIVDFFRINQRKILLPLVVAGIALGYTVGNGINLVVLSFGTFLFLVWLWLSLEQNKMLGHDLSFLLKVSAWVVVPMWLVDLLYMHRYNDLKPFLRWLLG